MSEQLSLAELKGVLENYRLNTPRVQRAIARRGAAFIAREATSNVNNDLVMKRSGDLMRYIGASLKIQKEEENSITIGLPAGEPLAIIGRVQETGATIRAKNWFINRTTADGVKHIYPESGPWLIFPQAGGSWHTKSGMISKAKGVTIQFAMVKEVTLNPRHWFSSAVEFYRQNMEREAREVIKKFLKDKGEVDDAMQT